MAFIDGQTLTAAQLEARFAQYLATGTCSAAILAFLATANAPAALSAIGAASSATVAGLIGALVYQGAWNASTNSPALASGVGTKGYVYKVSVTGTTTLDGNSVWAVGDMLVFNGTTWDKFDGSNTVINLATQVTGLLSSANLSIVAALPFGGYKGTGAADGTAATDLATLQQVQKGIPTQATAVAGTVDAVQVTMTPASTTWTLWEKVRWASGGANATTTPTISKDGGVTNKTIVKNAGAALASGDLGASGQIIEGVYNGTNVVLVSAVPFTGPTTTTTLATTSGTSVLFTGIPSNIKTIQIIIEGVQVSGTSPVMIQGGSGSITASGYVGISSCTTNSTSVLSYSAGFIINLAIPSGTEASTRNRYGLLTITKDAGSVWTISGNVSGVDVNALSSLAGAVSIGALDRINITTVGGANTFTAGSVTLVY